MNLDDDICYCFHVSLRKLLNFARREQPRCDSQMSDCLGAGTGCGWCIPILKKIRTWGRDGLPPALDMTPDQYAAARDAYRSDPTRRHHYDDRPPADPPTGDAAEDFAEPT